MSGQTPTGMGFWWGRWRDDHGSNIGVVPIMFFGDDEDDEGAVKIARIPSPEVCLALARYTEALARHEEDEDDEWCGAGAEELEALDDALRAERAGAQ